MSTPQVISVCLLAAVFAVSIWRRVNVGIVAFAATLLLSAVAPVSIKDALAAFPTDLCLLIIGVTLLFGHAEHSGIIDRLLELATGRLGHRRWLVPWLGFAAGAVLTTVGGFPTAIAAAVLPIISRLATANRVGYLRTAIITALGINSAGFSPLSTSGALIHTLAGKAHLDYPEWTLYVIVLGLHVVLALVTFALLGRKAEAPDKEPVAAVAGGERPGSPARSAGAQIVEDDKPRPPAGRFTGYQWACLAGLAIFVIITVAFRADVGMVAITLAFVLQLLFRPNEKELIAHVPWHAVILVAGLLVYLGALEHLGTLKSVGNALGHISSPVLGLLVLAYLTALVSNVESSTLVVLGVTIPLALSLAAGHPGLVLATLVTVSMAAAAPAINPAHIGGALILANTPATDPHHQRYFRALIAWAGTATALIPGVVALYPILSGL